MTPAQEAKDYAAANGYSIRPDGRRYDVFDVDAIVGSRLVANVGSYPAALNAMRKDVEEMAKILVCEYVHNVTTAEIAVVSASMPSWATKPIVPPSGAIFADAEFMRNWYARHPWVARIDNGGEIWYEERHATRAGAVKAIRQALSDRDMRQFVVNQTITYRTGQ